MTIPFRFSALALGVTLALAGCLPPASSPADEEKEPFFRKGKELANSLDFRGAADAFEKALEINPHNAMAHYELGLLSEKDDQAAAMYHFSKFTKLRPAAPQAERAKERINACRQELAQSAALSMTPNIQATQRELERLTVENREFKRQLDAWKKWYSAQQRSGAPIAQPQIIPAAPAVNHAPAPATPTNPVVPARAPQPEAVPLPPMPALRSHTVQRGETPAAIARKYGVGLGALMEANPTLDPRRMRVGQAVVIPAR